MSDHLDDPHNPTPPPPSIRAQKRGNSDVALRLSPMHHACRASSTDLEEVGGLQVATSVIEDSSCNPTTEDRRVEAAKPWVKTVRIDTLTSTTTRRPSLIHRLRRLLFRLRHGL